MTTLSLTQLSIRQLTEHIGSQGHAMAGATIAASEALASGLGLACVRINRSQMQSPDEVQLADAAADRLVAIQQRLLQLTDEDGAAITRFAALRDAGKMLEGQELLCQMPVEMGRLATEAASILQDFRPHARQAQDDLEMAIVLLAGAARASTLLLDSNLRLWPEPELAATFEPELAGLRSELENLHPVERIR